MTLNQEGKVYNVAVHYMHIQEKTKKLEPLTPENNMKLKDFFFERLWHAHCLSTPRSIETLLMNYNDITFRNQP